MSLFRLDGSIRTDGSASRAVADTVQAAWQSEHPDARTIRRDLGVDPLPATAWTTAVGALQTPIEGRTPAQHAAAALAGSLADELVNADAYLFAVPLYNFGVPQHVKAWIDTILTDPRLISGGPRTLAGRPAVLVVARGGGYGEGAPRAGWDHGTPYLQRILADVLELDVQVALAELTLADVTPAMAQLRGLAAESLRNAHATAKEHGRALARRLANSAA